MALHVKDRGQIMTVKLVVNGDALESASAPDTPLLWVLRDEFGLTGTKFGCGVAVCGACTVHVDGVAVKSCTMFAAEADGADVATIEGQAAPDGTLNAIQAAFQEHHGLQCGYCTPGMVMAAADLLKNNPKPTEAEVRHHLEGNICRCTGYHNIVKAILAASGQDVSQIAAE